MMPPKKRDTPFQAHHVDEFGLRICERAFGNSTAVATTACRFCEVFGKEESEVGMKRGRSERVKYFKAPFHKENYSSHHRRIHISQWAEYRELETKRKEVVFGHWHDLRLADNDACLCRSLHSPVTCPDRQRISSMSSLAR
jgi:hypothetical protein